MRSNPINPYPRAEKEMSAAIEYGYSPIALAWDRRVESFEIKKEKLNLHNGQVPIYRFNIKADFGQGLSNLKPLLKWQIELLKWLIKNMKSYDLIHAYDFDTVLPALFMKIFFNKKYVYDICDFYIDAFNVPKLLKPLIKKLDFYAIKNSEATILANESRIEQIKGSRYNKLIIIHNSPIEIKVSDNVKKQDKPTIFYGGILTNDRMILETINICKRHPEWNLVIAGFGPIEDKCKQAAEQYKNIKFLGKVPYREIISNTKASNIIFACYNPSIPNHKYSSPNKLYEAMMCKKPIIVCKNTGIDKLVKQENIGLVCDYKEESLEKCFEKLLSDRKICEQIGERSRKLYDEKYNWNIMKKRLGELYLQIFSGGE
jgi:glycosyltransferase involved in cell wall biosynthesis